MVEKSSFELEVKKIDGDENTDSNFETYLLEVYGKLDDAQKKEMKKILDLNTLFKSADSLEKRELYIREKMIYLNFFNLKRLNKNLDWEWNSKEVLSIILNKWVNELSEGDIYALKKSWVDLSNLFLVSASWLENPVKQSEIKLWDTFEVNFSNNKEAWSFIWAWDLFPREVEELKIKDNKWISRHVYYSDEPRPGYYYKNKWRKTYQEIRDGYKIEVLCVDKVSEEERKSRKASEKSRYTKVRSQEFKKDISKMYFSDSDSIDLSSSLDSDISLFIWILNSIFGTSFTTWSFKADENWTIKISKKNQEIAKGISDKDDLYLSEWAKKFEKYKQDIKKYCSYYDIPEKVLIQLYIKEWSHWDPTAVSPTWCTWLWQFSQWTWEWLYKWWYIYNSLNRKWKIVDYLDINSIHQRTDSQRSIQASCMYLRYIKDLKSCSWVEAMWYYNTWPWAKFSPEEHLRLNPILKGYISNNSSPSVEDVRIASRKYYGGWLA